MENTAHESFEGQLGGFSEQLDSLQNAAAVLREHPESLDRLAITKLHELEIAVGSLAKNMGLESIRQGTMTRRDLGSILGVHENTVSRWYTEAQSNNE
jgi:CRP-like cAMP-binding protein